MTGLISFSYDILEQISEAVIEAHNFDFYFQFLQYIGILLNIFNLICKVVVFIMLLTIYRILNSLKEGNYRNYNL
jgi:hypothetical protein